MQYLEEDLIQLAAYIDGTALPNHSVLVTGGTGLIGSVIVKALHKYNALYPHKKIGICVMARNEEKALAVFQKEFSSLSEAEKQGVRFIFQDICTPIKEKIECDYIIHTANPTESKYFITHSVETMDSIYTGTKNMLEYAQRASVKGMVYLSSMEVFGSVSAEHRIAEEELGTVDLQKVRSCYPEGKRLAECMCKCYAEEYGVNVKIARLAQTFGAGVFTTENRVFAQFARSAVRGEDIVLHTTGESMGNYCYIADAVRAILLLLEKGESGEAYTVVNEEMTMQIRDMAKLVIEEFANGKSQLVFDIPQSNVYGYAAPTKMRLSGEKLRALGWEPAVGMVEAYRRMLPDLLE